MKKFLSRAFNKLRPEDSESSGDEVEDASAKELSHVGEAAYDCLRKHHNHYHHELWNVTKGKMISLDYTPRDAFTRNDRTDPVDGHDDWFPEKIGELISRTEEWCDIVTLSDPTGKFLDAFKNALKALCTRENPLSNKIVVRILFGNVVSQPVNCNRVITELTKDLPPNAKDRIKLWVGSWRKGVSWNHAKLIAIDGKYLWTGGHNFWDCHYLKSSPVNDLSILMEGCVARDGHRFANSQWNYILKKQSTAWGRFVDKRIPDNIDVPRKARVTVSEFPFSGAAEFPPIYNPKNTCLHQKQLRRGPSSKKELDNELVPVITMGRYGILLKNARPSDDAFVEMFKAAKSIIRFALQDIGPFCIPGTKLAVPGMRWPKEYLNAIATALWTREVDIEIVLSNPGSIPNNLPMTEAIYGNGWDCVDVAAEIIKAIKDQFPDAPDHELRQKVHENLRVCFLRCPRGGCHYSCGTSLGLHSKHFIVDDVCTYIGSQNLYVCDLAEWGVVIDSPGTVADIKKQYWDPIWKASYTTDDCDVDKVMDSLGIDRGAPNKLELTKVELEKTKEAMKANMEMRFFDSDSSVSTQSEGDAKEEEK
mmetsp:Transcript_23677/g.65728  ORF Transcript_23677/g.65728 Transcript_23677/m.65728 type:complete len:591 (+) Transcript_23677:112-1884(+)|eukprot:CAMPEP_0172366056 /NCGR_PEP_ID=MMETSP1060-20121228/13530_1 /TAXON_ID=37318 /ORGANISM="Pseudo-nitzschia pungens, Strain cf. cingulata" /LENGTH=590 /DNA_ID=CAMNT_0013089749 /DNA_START=85 /DNA_END=1857 /DNA_ORIENTATION=+